jgi:hypothetical protein
LERIRKEPIVAYAKMLLWCYHRGLEKIRDHSRQFTGTEAENAVKKAKTNEIKGSGLTLRADMEQKAP